MKKIEIICDIDGCDGFIREPTPQHRLPIIFNTEQTEGRPVDPYLSYQNIDMCSECHESMIKSGKYLKGSGAQGHNKYVLGE